jgi:hypothetical protein
VRRGSNRSTVGVCGERPARRSGAQSAASPLGGGPTRVGARAHAVRGRCGDGGHEWAGADGDDALPWVRVFNHGFQGPGGWYIENSLTTLNQKDPVSEYNSVLWNSGIEANKEIARKQKRRLTYISNVLIVSDPKNPENEGQIKLYKFGKKIFDKLTEAMNPQFEDEKAINPFDFWDGANFKIKIRQVEGYRNYDKSEFESSSQLFDGDDAKLEALWKKEHSLKEFLDPKNFKSYDVLKAKLDKVLGLDGVAPVSKTKAEDFTPRSSPDIEDEELDYFKSLAED